MTTKTHPRAHRFVAALLAVFLLVSVCAIGVYADYADDYSLYVEIYQAFYPAQYWNWTQAESEAYYQSLCQKYPGRPDIAMHYAYILDQNSSADPNAVLAAYDHAIQLAEACSAQHTHAFYVSYDSLEDILQDAYESKATVYLTRLYQQENYIAAMRKVLDMKEQVAQMWFSGGLNYASAADDLQSVQAGRAELDAIEQWYKAGSPTSFTAWNGRAKFTGNGARTASFQLETPGSQNAYWRESFWDEPTVLDYQAVSGSFTCPANYTVLRGLNEVYFVVPAQEQASSITYAYQKNDGTMTRTQTVDGSNFTLGTYAAFCNIQTLSLPEDVKDYLQTECSDTWTSGGSAEIPYRLSILTRAGS